MKNVSIFCTALSALVLATLLFGSAFADVTISETTYEGRPQFVVRTPTATYYLDRAAGGFSRLLDREGNDWIAFHRNPLKEFPESAAAGYRGIPNLLFGSQNPDAGSGHPGFDQCTSHQQGRQSIVVNTQSQRWRWRWDFEDDHVTLSVLQTPPDIPYWFLYEGPVGGQWSPKTHFFGTDQGGPQRDMPANSNQLFGNWKWAYFGDDSTPRVLLVAQQEGDTLPDTLWYLGNEARGIESQDGMLVFGFGRGPGTQPLLTGNHRFRLAFVESPNGFQHANVSAVADQWLASDTWQLYADDAWRGPTPAQGRDWPDGQCFFQRYWFQMGEQFNNPSVNGRFRVNDPYVATHPTFHSRSEPKGNGMLTIPVQHSLRNIEAARLYLELWGGHPHSHNRRVSINGRSTYPIHNADDNHCTHIYEEIPILITDLVQGPNALQFAVDGEHTFWGHFIVEEAAIDVLLPTTSPQVQELDLSSPPQVSVDATETEQWLLSLDVSEQAATRIQAVHYFARYEGYDENGDGSRWDWHGMTKRKVPVGHLGSSTTYPFSCSWDVSMLAAQSDVAIRAIIEFQS
ncbi:MAG: hypothetical protein NXI32_18540, partial [bacterium]|nr:hypothetical protein [bacterium]